MSGVRAAMRLGAAAAHALPELLANYSSAMLEPFDLRDPARPTARSRLRLAVEAVADETVMAAYRLSVIDHPPHIVEQIAEEVDEAAKVFDRHGWFDKPTTYFEAPPALTDPDIERDRVGNLDIERLSFWSQYQPHADEPGLKRWASYDHNETAHAWVLRHDDEDRPWLILHHGSSMGWTLADLLVFRAAWLHHDLKLNLAFPVMPFHGPRARRSPFAFQLPIEDPVDTVHAIAQSVWDTRRLLTWIQSQSDQPIGLHGLSLGTHPASLVAALEPSLASITVGVPAASLSELYLRHMPGRLRQRPELLDFVEESRAILSVVSPLSVDPLIPQDRRFIYAATRDRVTEPTTQAEQLWSHWEEPEILWFSGGHSGVVWSRDVGKFVRRSLLTAGLIGEKP